jgi:cytochrome c oxidase subunit IV
LKREREALRASPRAARRRGLTDEEAPVLGLALSGGGIRSASICLGVLQAWNDTQGTDGCSALDRIDYLSTVSGGGYTGLGWLAWASRGGGAFPFERKENRDPGKEEDPPFLWLRNHAAYLVAPGVAAMVDVAAVVIRKLLANLLTPIMLVIGAAILLAGGRAVLNRLGMTPGALASSTVLILVVAGFVLSIHRAIRDSREDARRDAATRRERHRRLAGWVLAISVLLLFLSIQPWLLDRLGIGGDGRSTAIVAFATALAGLVPARLLGVIATYLRGRSGTLLLSLAAIVLLAMLWFLALFLASRMLAHATVGGVIDVGRLAWVLLASAVVWLVLWLISWRISPNATSLHGYYRDRLAEAFMGGIVTPRLSELLPERTGGPFPIVNATVNGAVRDNGQARRGRQASAFTFTPIDTGNDVFGYCTTAEMERADPAFDAASAMAISGAAVSSAMGGGPRLHVFLRGLLNLRTGRWMPTPGAAKIAQAKPRPARPGAFGFIAEVTGMRFTRKEDSDVLVSDGGHWENLGLLALLHRRCRRIIVIDAEADPAMTFNGLARATRLARLDLNQEVDVDLSPLSRNADGLVQRCHAMGSVKDGDGHPLADILYIKASVDGTEPPDVGEYRARYPDFPQESTSDQFFDEAQFESYRVLGWHMGKAVLEQPELRAWFDLPERNARPMA